MYLAFVAAAASLVAPAWALDGTKSLSQFTHTSWSANDGIPGPVQAIAQTSDGYLWLGTQAGLYRFDGLRFTAWESDSGGQSLPRSSVLSLCTARDTSLWIGFAGGAISQLRHGILKNYSSADGLHSGGVVSIAEDRNGTIWAGGQYGFSRFENGQWQRVGMQIGYPAPGVRALFVDRRGTLWAATDGLDFGLGKDPVRLNTLMTLAPNASRFSGTGQAVGYIAQIAEAPNGEIWLAEYSGPGPTVRPAYGRSGANIERAVQGQPRCLIFDGGTSLWIGLYRGGVRRAADFTRLERSSFDQFGGDGRLSGDGILSAFKDREGNLWFGTTGGLDRFRENKATPFSEREGLIANPQMALASTQDEDVWAINYATDVVYHFRHGSIDVSKLKPYSKSDSTRILSVYADRRNRVWVGGSFGLAEGIDWRFSFVPTPGTAEKTNVEGVVRDSAGNLWISVWVVDRGPSVLRFQDGKWTDFRDTAELPRYRCRVLYADRLGRVWLGFENGEVAVYANGGFQVYSKKDGLPRGRILSIAADRAGHVWIAGESGLSRFDGRRFATLTKQQGLPGNSISAVLEDDDGSLWLAGALGVMRTTHADLEKALHSPSYNIQGLILDATDGLPGLPRQEEPFPTATRAADGKLWFATTGGVAVINPRRLPKNAVPPPVVIESAWANNRTFAGFSKLHLQPGARNIDLKFAALSLSVPEHVLFRYRLDGYDREWHGPLSARGATYTNLPPGTYKFRVTASNNDGVWNDDGATLVFSIVPVFYETSWFSLVLGAIAACVLWGVYQWRGRQLTARLDLRFAERLSERERIARELHDTLLQNVAGLSLQIAGVSKIVTAPEVARERLEGLKLQAEDCCRQARQAVWDIRSADATGDLTVALQSSGERLTAGKDIRFILGVEGRPTEFGTTVREHLLRIAREAIGNAVQHASAKEILVQLRFDAGVIRLRISDDGQGFHLDGDCPVRSGHFGLATMRERAGQIGASITIESTPGCGTCVEVIVAGGDRS